MAEVENLAIIIDIIGDYEDELNQLLFKLGEVQTAVDAVDGQNIDLNTRPATRELAGLEAQLAALKAQNIGSVDMDVGGGRAAGGLTPGQMGAMSQQASSVGDRLSDLDLRMTDLHNALARMVPLILVFIGALPAVIGSLVSLAAAAMAAAAALVGIGAFAALGGALARGDGDIAAGFQDILREIQSDFMDAFEPLARRLQPLFGDAIDGLDRLFEAVAAEGDALVDFADTARDFGEWVINTLPSFLRDLAQFADAAGGALAAVGEGLGGADWFGAFADFLAETTPAMIQFGTLLFSITETVLNLSVGFLQVTNALLFVLDVFLEIITVGGMLDQQMGVLIATGLALYGVLLILNSAMLGIATTGLVSMGRSIIQMVASLAGYIGVSGSAISSTLGLAASMRALSAAIALTGIGALAVLLGGIASAATNAATNIDGATDSLRALRREQNRLDSGRNPYAHPDVRGREGTGRSRFAGGDVNVNVQNSNVSKENIRNQTHNGMYRLERKQRSR